ncbi:MAG: ABC1 kinase family protein [Spirochaetia bacterium]
MNLLKESSDNIEKKHPQRYASILNILTKYGLSEFAKTSGVLKKFSWVKDIIPEKDHRNLSEYLLEEKIRLAMEELGPTFIKFGQIMSNRHDLFSQEFIDELTKLQDKVPPFPTEEAVQIIEEELERPIEEVFRYFDPEPIAAASIAQVHQAVLPNGDEVVVKVRRPNIESLVETDVDIMLRLARIIERRIPHSELFNPQNLVREFRKQIREEMDLHNEFLNIIKFRSQFEGDVEVAIPKPYANFSTKRILTMEKLVGIRMGEVIREEHSDVDKKMLAYRGARIVFQMAFINGFFHADPHPGNLLVLPGNVLGLMDFGMTGIITEYRQEQINNIMIGMINRNANLIVRSFLNLTNPPKRLDKEALVGDVEQYMRRYIDLPLEEVDFSKSLQDLINIIVAHKISLPMNMTLMSKALMIIADVAEQLDPDFVAVEHLERFLPKLLLHKFNPAKLAKNLFMTGTDYIDLIQNMPGEIRGILKSIRDKKIGIDIGVSGLDPLRETLDRIGFRLVYGLVLASLLISSSLIVLANVGPTWREIPVLGLIGFIIGGVMGVIFLFSGFIRMLRWSIHKVKRNVSKWI